MHRKSQGSVCGRTVHTICGLSLREASLISTWIYELTIRRRCLKLLHTYTTVSILYHRVSVQGQSKNIANINRKGVYSSGTSTQTQPNSIHYYSMFLLNATTLPLPDDGHHRAREQLHFPHLGVQYILTAYEFLYQHPVMP